MAKKSNPKKKNFFAGFGIGDEIKETSTFLKKLMTEFMKMIHLFYKTLKKYVFNGILELWPLYISLFFVGIVASLFSKEAEKNILFIIYIGVLFITLLVFLLIIRLLELELTLFLKIISEFKNLVNDTQKKKYFNGFKDFLICCVCFLFMAAVGCFIAGLCWGISNFNSIIDFIYKRMEGLKI